MRVTGPRTEPGFILEGRFNPRLIPGMNPSHESDGDC